jgi:hypothetical protein
MHLVLLKIDSRGEKTVLSARRIGSFLLDYFFILLEWRPILFAGFIEINAELNGLDVRKKGAIGLIKVDIIEINLILDPFRSCTQI